MKKDNTAVILPILSSRTFKMSIIHFEIIFLYGVKNDVISLFTCNCTIFPTQFAEDTIVPTLCSLTSFVVDSLIIGAWNCFWAFYPIPLIYISIFVQVPYCFDDCSFVDAVCCVQIFVTLGTVAHYAHVSSTILRGLLKFISVESVMLSNHLILCHPFSYCLQSFPALGLFQ